MGNIVSVRKLPPESESNIVSVRKLPPDYSSTFTSDPKKTLTFGEPTFGTPPAYDPILLTPEVAQEAVGQVANTLDPFIPSIQPEDLMRLPLTILKAPGEALTNLSVRGHELGKLADEGIDEWLRKPNTMDPEVRALIGGAGKAALALAPSDVEGMATNALLAPGSPILDDVLMPLGKAALSKIPGKFLQTEVSANKFMNPYIELMARKMRPAGARDTAFEKAFTEQMFEAIKAEERAALTEEQFRVAKLAPVVLKQAEDYVKSLLPKDGTEVVHGVVSGKIETPQVIPKGTPPANTPVVRLPGLRTYTDQYGNVTSKFATPEMEAVADDITKLINPEGKTTLSKKVTWKESKTQAERLAWTKEKALDRIQPNKGQLSDVEANALGGVIANETERMTKLVALEKELPEGSEALLVVRQALVQSKMDLARMQTVYSLKFSATARQLNLAKAQLKTFDENLAQLAKYLAKQDDATRDNVLKLLRDVKFTPEAIMDQIAKMKSWSPGRMVLEYSINSMLTGLQTQVVNIGTSLGNILSSVPERVGAGLIDKAAHPALKWYFRGAGRQRFAGEAVKELSGMLDGLQVAGRKVVTPEMVELIKKWVTESYWENTDDVIAGMRKAWEDLNGTLLDPKELQGLLETKGLSMDYAIKGRPGKNEPIDKLLDFIGPKIRLPGSVLAFEDLLLSEISKGGNIYVRAARVAYKEGYTQGTPLFEARFNAIVRDPSLIKGLLTEAEEEAAMKIFREESIPILKSFVEGLNKYYVFKFLSPFVTIGPKVFAEAARKTLLTFALPSTWKKLKRPPIGTDPAELEAARGAMVDVLAKAAVWFPATKLLWDYASSGENNIMLAMPTNPREEDDLLAHGVKEYSIRIGKHYYSYLRSMPFGGVIAFTEMARRSFVNKDAKGFRDNSLDLAAQVLEFAGSQTFLQNYEHLAKAISTGEGEQWDRFSRGVATGAMIPTLMGNIAKALDPTVRVPKSMKEAFSAKTPRQTELVPPKVLMFGETIERPGPFMNTLINPILKYEYKDEPARDFLKAFGFHKVLGGKLEQNVKASIAPEIIPGTKLKIPNAIYTKIVMDTGPQIKKWILDNQEQLIAKYTESGDYSVVQKELSDTEDAIRMKYYQPFLEIGTLYNQVSEDKDVKVKQSLKYILDHFQPLFGSVAFKEVFMPSVLDHFNVEVDPAIPLSTETYQGIWEILRSDLLKNSVETNKTFVKESILLKIKSDQMRLADSTEQLNKQSPQ